MSKWNCFAKLLFSAAVLVWSINPIAPQVEATRIVGAVTDPNQALVLNADVQALQLSTSQVKILHAIGTGEFVFTPLEPSKFLRNNDLERRNYFALTREHLRRNTLYMAVTHAPVVDNIIPASKISQQANVDTSSGGVVATTSGNPRNLQFALKLTF